MTRQLVVICEYQAAVQFDYLQRRVSYAVTASEEDHWRRQIQYHNELLEAYRRQ
jgi:hypothetical protein